MEKKQLDFDQPFLSVRRLSSTLASSDAVNKKKIEKSFPHRQHSLPLCKSEWELGEVTKPAKVPFLWEHIPGRPKGGKKAESQSPVKPSNTPRLPPGRVLDVPKLLLEENKDRNVFKPQIEGSPLNDCAILWERLKKVSARGGSESENEDDVYSDAQDTLSPTETLSMSGSVSCLSGYGGSDAKPSGTFSADAQTRDFMMNRFLPAAKAMVLRTPQHAAKKQPMTPEHPRLVKKVVGGERRPPIEQQRSPIVPRYGQYKEDTESEDGDDEHVNSGKKTVKLFGLFSRFCLKNSLCLLNPVPGMKAGNKTPRNAAKEGSRLHRTAHSGPLAQITNEHLKDAAYKKQINSRAQSHELYKVKSGLTGEPNWQSCSSNLQNGMSPHNSFRRGGISPYRNESPRSPFREGMGFLGVPNGAENGSTITHCSNFQGITCNQRYKQELGSMTPEVEKTLYIDTVNIVKLPFSESISPGAKSLKDCSGNDCAISVDSSRIEETANAESFVQQIRCLDALEGRSTSSGSVDADKVSSARGQDQQSVSSDCSKSITYDKLDIRNEHIPKAVYPNASLMLSPLPPPLPKSPSESWLWRTLPSTPSRHRPFSQSGLGTQFHSKKQHAKTTNLGTKWETIVKTSNVHHDHVRYSEELVPHVSQHSKAWK